MDTLSSTLLLKLALGTYAAATLGSLLCLRRDKIANLVGFGGATLAAVLGLAAAIFALLQPAPCQGTTFELWASLIPYLTLSIRLDPLGAFFVLIASLLG